MIASPLRGLGFMAVKNITEVYVIIIIECVVIIIMLVIINIHNKNEDVPKSYDFDTSSFILILNRLG